MLSYGLNLDKTESNQFFMNLFQDNDNDFLMSPRSDINLRFEEPVPDMGLFH